MAEKVWDLRERLIQFSLRILRLCAAIPDTPEGRLIRGQLIRCGTSPGAQHREASRARSPAEFVSKMESGQQELDETDYWLTLLERSEIMKPPQIRPLQGECGELLRIFASSAKSAKEAR